MLKKDYTFKKSKIFMKLFLNTILFLLISSLFENSAYSLSDYRIKEICQKRIRRTNCIKEMKIKKLKLLQGNRIEIPILPYKK